jgi:hypothetical protein
MKAKKCERHVRNYFFEPETIISVMTVEYYGKICPMFLKDDEVCDE